MDWLKNYQTLVGTAATITAAILIVPRVVERYARAREYWTQRMRLAADISVFAADAAGQPDAPADVLDRLNADFQPLLLHADQLAKRGNVLYADRLHRSLFSLFVYSITLRKMDRMAFWVAAAYVLGVETQGAAIHSHIGSWAKIWRLTDGLYQTLTQSEEAKAQANPTVDEEIFALRNTLLTSLRKAYRREVILRPWLWLKWRRWEIWVRKELTIKSPAPTPNPHLELPGA